jgi:N-acetyl-gamma-glutamyl-phosphate reductase
MQRAGIVGYRGYSGAELVRILERHPHIVPVLLEHREAGPAPSIRRRKRHAGAELGPDVVEKEQLTVVFLATPPEVSMELAPGLLAAGARVVDLSGAFRLGTPER